MLAPVKLRDEEYTRVTQTLKTRLPKAALIAAAALTLAGPAAAAPFLGYELRFNDPVFNTQNGVNNVPDIQLENISTNFSNNTITKLELTIGDTNFAFDFVRNESAIGDGGDPLTFTRISPDTTNDNSGDDFLEYDFLGFNPNEIFQFEVDVDNDDGTFLQDYREILFPTSVASVTFSDGTTLSQTLIVDDATQDGFRFSQTVDIPEPATIALFGSMALLGAALRRRT
ncbi:MAG: PEP-CTERM sorting domain-containing protein [Pseudomonadota bacterium]